MLQCVTICKLQHTVNHQRCQCGGGVGATFHISATFGHICFLVCGVCQVSVCVCACVKIVCMFGVVGIRVRVCSHSFKCAKVVCLGVFVFRLSVCLRSCCLRAICCLCSRCLFVCVCRRRTYNVTVLQNGVSSFTRPCCDRHFCVSFRQTEFNIKSQQKVKCGTLDGFQVSLLTFFEVNNYGVANSVTHFGREGGGVRQNLSP